MQACNLFSWIWGTSSTLKAEISIQSLIVQEKSYTARTSVCPLLVMGNIFRLWRQFLAEMNNLPLGRLSRPNVVTFDAHTLIKACLYIPKVLITWKLNKSKIVINHYFGFKIVNSDLTAVNPRKINFVHKFFISGTSYPALNAPLYGRIIGCCGRSPHIHYFRDGKSGFTGR